MLSEITSYEDQTTLIMGSGIQFLDFAASFIVKGQSGEFAKLGEAGPLGRLQEDERTGKLHFSFDEKKSPVSSRLDVSLDQSLKLFADVWLPVPYFRFSPPSRFEEGPSNWARVRITEIAAGDDPEGHTHRITFAFDTKVLPNRSDTSYMGPSVDDVKAGTSFAFAHRSHEMGWFLDQQWIDAWLREVFSEFARPRLKKDAEDIRIETGELQHQAHYLNILHLLGTQLKLPEIKVISNAPNDLYKPIPVDLVLDIGNSRSCGILIEDHPQESDGLRRRYELELRDLTKPECVYVEPFESRVEFSQASFGKDHFSVQSGRNDAFLWPTIARVGREVGRLASLRRGTEGATGLSSPKRYLWDQESFEPGWRFNTSYVKTEAEPHATAAPVSRLINEMGQALYTLDPEDRMPVFHPHYSRSSLMTFMLCEVLAQALAQINSPAQRLRQSHARVPRHLRSIILTIPPAMPQPERKIFQSCMNQAIGLIWKSMGWHPEDAGMDTEEDRDLAFPTFPEVHVQWDEATCGQVVYVFSETHNNFGGRPEEFFAALARPDQPEREGSSDPYVSIATIDIGGGTTDLVINEYALDKGPNNAGREVGGSAYIIPEQRFRDGFKIAGDDIVLDVIRLVVLPSIAASFKAVGVPEPDALLSRLMGSESLDAQVAVLRQQLTLQVLYPVALRVIKEYEKYDPLESGNLGVLSLSELMADAGKPTQDVLDYVNTAVQRAGGASAHGFRILDVGIGINLRRLHEQFIRGELNICKTLKALCEVVYAYQPDVLLLTGRPSRMPGVLAYVRSLLSLPPGRILPMHQYRTGPWYPFHKNGRIDDPKSTAAVGAMLCLLSRSLRLPNFFFRSAAFKPYSTLRFIGMIDNNNAIKDSNVFYRDIDLDHDEYEFPDTTFEMRGSMRIGFRQLKTDRWPASPLYTLSVDDPDLREKLASKGVVLKIALRRSERAGPESFELASVEGGAKSKVKFRLNTMIDAGLGDSQYWLDSGSVR